MRRRQEALWFYWSGGFPLLNPLPQAGEEANARGAFTLLERGAPQLVVEIGVEAETREGDAAVLYLDAFGAQAA